jgi:hypothetical protein
MIGTCKLCQISGVELQDSHLLPKAAYRQITKSQNGQPPVVIMSGGTLMTNDQVRGHFFCKTCEDRFNKNGEDYVMKNCYRNGQGFALKDALDAAQPIFDRGDEGKLYYANQVNGIDAEKLAYFATSAIWKASVHGWKNGGRPVDSLSLGREYGEQFRQFLLGNASFPPKTTLWISIITDNNIWNGCSFPYGGKNDYGFWRYHFQFFGIYFSISLGNLVPAVALNFCFARSADHPISFVKDIDRLVMDHTLNLMAESPRVGSYKRKKLNP